MPELCSCRAAVQWLVCPPGLLPPATSTRLQLGAQPWSTWRVRTSAQPLLTNRLLARHRDCMVWSALSACVSALLTTHARPNPPFAPCRPLWRGARAFVTPFAPRDVLL
jgi:hypothetical protein